MQTICINYYDRAVEKCQANCLTFVACASCNNGRNGCLGMAGGKHLVSNRVSAYGASSLTPFEGIIGVTGQRRGWTANRCGEGKACQSSALSQRKCHVLCARGTTKEVLNHEFRN